MKIAGILILSAFYAVYFGKMLLQRKQGIQTDHMAKGAVKDKVYYIELAVKLSTVCTAAAEVISIFTVTPPLPKPVQLLGMLLGWVGVGVFAAAVVTMKDSWRAGLAREDETKMVTGGIYQFSRNPAFLGFDCVFLGTVLMFFNWVLLFISLFAALMLHLLILQEEAYLPGVFGDAYLEYKGTVCRYLGRKK